MDECIFCEIINGKIPAAKVYEDNSVIAFLDINPANKGHILVIPKKHVETMDKMSSNTLSNLTIITQMITKIISKATSCHGYNVIMNNKPAAGQAVPHAHFHVIPRLENDNIIPTMNRQRYEEHETEEYTNAIKKEIDSYLNKENIYIHNNINKKSKNKNNDYA